MTLVDGKRVPFQKRVASTRPRQLDWHLRLEAGNEVMALVAPACLISTPMLLRLLDQLSRKALCMTPEPDQDRVMAVGAFRGARAHHQQIRRRQRPSTCARVPGTLPDEI